MEFIAIPPAPDGFNNSVSRNNIFNFTWDPEFNSVYSVDTYRLSVSSGGSFQCPSMCLVRDGSCQCSGLMAGRNETITLTAINCGDQEGPGVLIEIAPQGTIG